MNRVELNLNRFGSHGTRLLGRFVGERFPLYYVSEYPKSGGTWLGQMIADYLQIPFPQNNLLPIAHAAVIHNHWRYDPRLRRVFYLVRDGRDVMVSLFFHRMRHVRNARAAGVVHPFERTYRRVLGADFDPDDARRHLLPFMQHEVAHPVGCPVFWGAHVEQWAFDRPHVVLVRYEDLLRDGVGTLERALPTHTGKAFDRGQAEMTVRKFSFERQTGRAKGAEDRTSFRRKGVAGDWVNHFSQEAATWFDRTCGSTLVKLGYAEDRAWTSLIAPSGA